MNAGSLDDALKARTDLTLPEKMAASVKEYVRHFEDRGFGDIVVSAKAHDVMTTVRAYRVLAREIPEIPLHIGITETFAPIQQSSPTLMGSARSRPSLRCSTSRGCCAV